MGSGAVKYLLDTHAWVWWNTRPDALSTETRELIENTGSNDSLLLSAISPWEFCKLVEKGRVGIAGDMEKWLDVALDIPRLYLFPLSPKIAYRSTALTGTFHSDPADQIIVATAQVEDAVIITRDRRIAKYPYVRTFW